MSPPDDRHGSGLEIVLSVLFALLLVYVLSVGPVVKTAQALGMDSDGLKTFYAPLVWAHDRTPLRKPLEWYIGAWGVH